MSGVVAIMMRSPSDPRILARLAPRLPGEHERRDLALAGLDDLVDRVEAMPGVLARVAVTPPVEGLRVHRPELPASACLAQRGAGVAERLRHLFEDLGAAGFTRALAIVRDVPDLPAGHLEQALAWLDRGHTGVIGPSDNGACYAIGLTIASGAVPDVCSDVRWDTPHAQDDAARACARAGLDVKYLSGWPEVDAPADLDLLAGRLRYAPQAAPKTAAVLRRLGLIN